MKQRIKKKREIIRKVYSLIGKFIKRKTIKQPSERSSIESEQ
jgi:hypothetical protein